MKHSIEIFVLAFVATLVATAAGAQWAVYKKPTARDWAAMANLPDFSGVWERGGGGGRGRGGARGRGGGPGRASGPTPTPEYAALAEQLRASAGASQSANCLPPGMPGIMSQPYPMEFLMTPGKVTIVIEAYTEVRHIYTDGRELPEDPDPGFFGTSIGHWEGDTLVAETIGFNDLVRIGRGLPHSDQMKITERFSLLDDDTMQIETTISDPKALTEPYTTYATLARHRDWTIAEYVCEENNRNFVDSSGDEGIILDNPGGLPPPPN
jgi:hypothetical protein